jgi:hypothetical protein
MIKNPCKLLKNDFEPKKAEDHCQSDESIWRGCYEGVGRLGDG